MHIYWQTTRPQRQSFFSIWAVLHSHWRDRRAEVKAKQRGNVSIDSRPLLHLSSPSTHIRATRTPSVLPLWDFETPAMCFKVESSDPTTQNQDGRATLHLRRCQRRGWGNADPVMPVNRHLNNLPVGAFTRSSRAFGYPSADVTWVSTRRGVSQARHLRSPRFLILRLAVRVRCMLMQDINPRVVCEVGSSVSGW